MIFLALLFFGFIILGLMSLPSGGKPPRVYLQDPESGEVISFRAERVLRRDPIRDINPPAVPPHRRSGMGRGH